MMEDEYELVIGKCNEVVHGERQMHCERYLNSDIKPLNAHAVVYDKV